jgi:lipopolysaccharide/colanic/teichoic acid biosynthesis glycosyltransferase
VISQLFKCKTHALLKLITMTLLSWYLFAEVISLDAGMKPLYAWEFIILSSVYSLLVLNLMGFITYNEITSRKIGLLLFPASIVLGGIFARISIYNIADYAPYKSKEILILATVLSSLVFMFFFALSQVKSKVSSKKKVVLDVPRSEANKIKALFRDHGMDSFMEYFTRDEFERFSSESDLNEVDLIVISRKSVNRFQKDGLLIRAHLCGIPIMDKKRVMDSLSGRINLNDSDLWSYVLFAKPQTASMRFYDFTKSIIEPPIALIMLILLLPLMVAISILIKLTSKGPVLYSQKRTGYLGEVFDLYKFRTMIVDSEVDGPQWSSRNDNRITKIGAILRKTRIDELPQLINVIKGEMGFIGPRPERPEIYEKLKSEIPLFSMRTIITPGITGWAQVSAGYASTVSESFDKLEYDLFYIQNMSPSFDFIILLKTIKVAVLGSEYKENDWKFDSELLFRASSIFAIAILLLIINASFNGGTEPMKVKAEPESQVIESKEETV